MDRNSIAARKQRWLTAYDKTAPPQHLFIIGYNEKHAGVSPWPAKKQERIELSWVEYCKMRERSEWLQDDAIPYLDVFTGTEIFAEAFGCSVHRPEDNMPFALPLIAQASEVAALKVPDVGASSLALLFEIADELYRRGGDEGLLKIVDIQSPMDIAALIWSKTDFYMALSEAPEAVQELSHKVLQLLTAFLDEWFNRYGKEFIAHCPAYYMPNGITLSEDEIGSVNAKTFKKLFLPELKSLSERYGGLGIHCCASARHQWPGLLEIPNLRVLNLSQPPEVTRAAYPFFASHVVQIHDYVGESPAWTWPSLVPAHSRVVFRVSASSKDEARQLADSMWEACGREGIA